MKGLSRSLVAGFAGTAVETLWSSLGDRWRGPVVYDPPLMAGRLAARWLDRDLEPRWRPWAGAGMRWTYGPSWSLGLGLLRGGRPLGATWPLWGVGLGAALFGFELVTLPLVDATPPLAHWGRSAIAADAVGALAYGLTVAAVQRYLPDGSR